MAINPHQWQIVEPFWMPEIGLGIRRCVFPSSPLEREMLSWFDEQSNRHFSAEEQERNRADQEQRQRQRLEAYLRSQGIDPNQLPE